MFGLWAVLLRLGRSRTAVGGRCGNRQFVVAGDRSLSFLFTRTWMQWYGGLGIVVFSVALVVRPGVTARQLMLVGVEQGSVIGNTRVHARRALVVYGAMTAIAIVALLLASRSLFDAVTYACAAVSTGGFAPHDDSLAGMPGGPAAWLLTVLICLAGAVPLVLYEMAFRGNWRDAGLTHRKVTIDCYFRALEM